ncbi:DNA-processing protein DprA [Alkanindiges sp. WGS2144]|uniref:DNA-processing protein DprA n=1 Tax=Alkanindiges sp. WGS2144 TaxID=3366808 RepID=UPI003753A484
MAINWSQQLLDELALWFVVQHSVSAYTTLLKHFGTARQALQASSVDWQALALHHAHTKKLTEWQQNPALAQRFEQAIHALNHAQDQVISLKDSSYPRQLKQIADPPPFLFVRGNLHALNQPQIAIVGSRKPSQTGQQIAERFAHTLAEQGFFIASGLAYGIDAHAHRGALAAGSGQTIAVMGTGVNLCYPAAHQSLYWQIVEAGGAIVSEFMPGTPAREYHFPRRNRIVSGLSLGILVVEAALKSGSLITAQAALEQNRQVFAIPGHIYNEQSRGCHQLIREGAILVDEPQHIVDEMDLPRRWQQQACTGTQAAPVALDTASPSTVSLPPASPLITIPEHLQLVYQALDWVGLSLDDLVETVKIDVATLTSHLMEMELMGIAVQQGGLYQRCRQ